MDTIPNGLKKLPKGYVYDTEINQSTLMHLSINPSQTGEFIEHLRQVLFKCFFLSQQNNTESADIDPSHLSCSPYNHLEISTRKKTIFRTAEANLVLI